VLIVAPLEMMPKVSTIPVDWSEPQRSMQLRTVTFVQPAPAPWLLSQIAALAAAVPVFEKVRSRVARSPALVPSKTTLSAPLSLTSAPVMAPATVGVAPASGFTVIVKVPPS